MTTKNDMTSRELLTVLWFVFCTGSCASLTYAWVASMTLQVSWWSSALLCIAAIIFCIMAVRSGTRAMQIVNRFVVR